VSLVYESDFGFFLKTDVPVPIVSRPAFATTTATYGKKTAPTSANQRNGLGNITVRMKQSVRTIMEIK
jgi:hypothetical protein